MTVEELQQKYFILTAEEQDMMLPIFAASLLLPTTRIPPPNYAVYTVAGAQAYYVQAALKATRWHHYTISLYGDPETKTRKRNLNIDLIIPSLTALYGPYLLGVLGTSAETEMAVLNYTLETPILAILAALFVNGYTDYGEGNYTIFGFTNPPVYFYENAPEIAEKIRAINLYGAEMVAEMNSYKLASSERLAIATADAESRINQANRDAIELEREAVLRMLDYETQYQFALDSQTTQMALLSLQLEQKLESMK